MIGGKGTFSGETGGSIKSYGNIFTGKYIYAPYSEKNKVEFDAYEASSRDEKVPATITAKSGGDTYSNFDTDNSLMYSYTPDAAEDVPAVVCGWYGAGRMNHGDLQYAFNAYEDSNYGVIDGLKSLIQNYKSPVKKIFGINNASSETGGGEQGGGEQGGGEQGGGEQGGGTTISADVECTFMDEAPSSTLFTIISGNYSTSKGFAKVNGTTYTTCLKMESETSIKFKIEKPMTLTLVFASTEIGKKVKIDSTKYTTDSNATVSVQLAAGEHTITKGDSINLFYIGLSE